MERGPIEQTKLWLDKFIIARNICPFAASAFRPGLVRFQVSQANRPEDLRRDFKAEVDLLIRTKASEIETTLLIHPFCLQDFEHYWSFVGQMEEELQYQGADTYVQVASFHPQYLFAGSDECDPANYTNRSPYPMLHLLREDSLDEAIDAYGETEEIPENNIKMLQKIGLPEIRKILDNL